VKSQGEIESAVCDGISRFQQEFIGRGPSDIHAHLVGSLLVVRLHGVLTPAERRLISGGQQVPAAKARGDGVGDGATSPLGDGHHRHHGDGQQQARDREKVATVQQDGDHDHDNGRALLKQVRSHMVATGRRWLQTIVEEAAGVGLVSVHHDISTITGEELFAFSLSQSPACRPKKQVLRSGRSPVG